MNESDVRRKIYRHYRHLGYWPITQTDAVKCACGRMFYPKKGRPDILLMHPKDRSMVCEVKALRAGSTSFSFDEIDESQRKWLDRWEEDGGIGLIGFGIIRQHGKRQLLDNLYLIPWFQWKNIEEIVKPIQSSIPYKAGPGYKRELQDNKYDIENLFRTWEL